MGAFGGGRAEVGKPEAGSALGAQLTATARVALLVCELANTTNTGQSAPEAKTRPGKKPPSSRRPMRAPWRTCASINSHDESTVGFSRNGHASGSLSSISIQGVESHDRIHSDLEDSSRQEFYNGGTPYLIIKPRAGGINVPSPIVSVLHVELRLSEGYLE